MVNNLELFLIFYTVSTLFFEYMVIRVGGKNGVSMMTVFGVMISLIYYILPMDTINEKLFNV